jgi:hypothetical protein
MTTEPERPQQEIRVGYAAALMIGSDALRRIEELERENRRLRQELEKLRAAGSNDRVREEIGKFCRKFRIKLHGP